MKRIICFLLSLILLTPILSVSAVSSDTKVYGCLSNDEMKIAASEAIAAIIKDDELNEDYIIPDAFDERVAKNVARAVSKAAASSGVARIKPEEK